MKLKFEFNYVHSFTHSTTKLDGNSTFLPLTLYQNKPMPECTHNLKSKMTESLDRFEIVVGTYEEYLLGFQCTNGSTVSLNVGITT